MKFVSTRGLAEPLNFSQAVMEGLASDGGLFVPEKLPDISGLIDSWEGLPYSKLCFEFLKIFAPEIPEADLLKIAENSYKNFDDPQIAPLSRLDENLYLLELYHGPTLAFKDFALQLLGNLYEYLLGKSGKSINVLGATSGDTGSAAINGLLGKKGVNIFILYPNAKVSPLQERQMACTGAKNV
ncbi:MAG: threonine synthase, partial [Opitutales bacterium]|nr:threonine synthase [Opitutales bacterium]